MSVLLPPRLPWGFHALRAIQPSFLAHCLCDHLRNIVFHLGLFPQRHQSRRRFRLTSPRANTEYSTEKDFHRDLYRHSLVTWTRKTLVHFMRAYFLAVDVLSAFLINQGHVASRPRHPPELPRPERHSPSASSPSQPWTRQMVRGNGVECGVLQHADLFPTS